MHGLRYSLPGAAWSSAAAAVGYGLNVLLHRV